MAWFVATGFALASFYDIERNIGQLPTRIPTHFNLAGQADHWGTRDQLWFLFAMQVLISALLLFAPMLARRAPGLVHIGRRLNDFSSEQRERMLPLFTQMMTGVAVLVAFGFHFLLHESMHTAAEPEHRIPVYVLLGLFLAGPAALAAYFVPRINRIARAPR